MTSPSPSALRALIRPALIQSLDQFETFEGHWVLSLTTRFRLPHRKEFPVEVRYDLNSGAIRLSDRGAVDRFLRDSDLVQEKQLTAEFSGAEESAELGRFFFDFCYACLEEANQVYRRSPSFWRSV